MTRIARSSALLALASDASFTPDTFDQVIAMLLCRELLSDLSVLCVEKEMRFDPLVSLLQPIGTRSLPRFVLEDNRCKNARLPEGLLSCHQSHNVSIPLTSPPSSRRA